MAIKFKTGEQVTQVLPLPIKGVVSRYVFNENTGEITYVISSLNESGAPQERIFREEELKLAE